MLQNKISQVFPTQEFDDRLVISCGEASIILFKNGRIELKGTAFIQTADTIELNAKRVDICP